MRTSSIIFREVRAQMQHQKNILQFRCVNCCFSLFLLFCLRCEQKECICKLHADSHLNECFVLSLFWPLEIHDCIEQERLPAHIWL